MAGRNIALLILYLNRQFLSAVTISPTATRYQLEEGLRSLFLHRTVSYRRRTRYDELFS